MRIPFEMADPGTDPTRRPNPHPKRSVWSNWPWFLAGAVFLVFGYAKFIKPDEPKTARAIAPTATSTPVITPTFTSGLFDQNNDSVTGFLPTQQPIQTPTLFPSPIPPPTPEGFTYGVFLDGEQIICMCTLSGEIVGDDICNAYIPSMCEGTDG